MNLNKIIPWNNTFLRFVLILIALVILDVEVKSQQVGLIQKSAGVYDGYTLLHPQDSETTYLITNDGKVVNSWPSTSISGKAVYLLENGKLLRTLDSKDPFLGAGGAGGIIELVNWDGTAQWRFNASEEGVYRQHHDVQYLPNGNILSLEWVPMSKEDALLNGRDPELMSESQVDLWFERVTEYKPVGTNSVEVIWQWDLRDHLVQDFDETKLNFGSLSDNPGRFDINSNKTFGSADIIHANSMSYNPEYDQIIISTPFLNEIWIIDHSTTTAEAQTSSGGLSNRGGDFLYRWGNPQLYNSGLPEDQQLYGQHNVKWILDNDEWKIQLFNNGLNRPEGNYSTIELLTLPFNSVEHAYEKTIGESYLPMSSSILYIADQPTDFYSRNISGSQRLPNGNLLICEGQKGKFFEVNSSNEIQWIFINPKRVNNELCLQDLQTAEAGGVFRAEKYGIDYPGIPENVLVSDINYWEVDCIVNSISDDKIMEIWPNHFNEIINISTSSPIDKIQMIDFSGKVILEQQFAEITTELTLKTDNLKTGHYILSIHYNQGGYNYRHVLKH